MIDQSPAIANDTEASAGARLSPGSRLAGVALKDGAHSVIAVQPIEAGEAILTIHGIFVEHPSMYSIQVDDALHIELPGVKGLTSDPDRHPWRYLNHSCEPNAALSGLTLVALKPIQRWEQITFDYNTTEYEMSTPFGCDCGHCGGAIIRGFKFLEADHQRRLYPRLADYLRRKLDGDGIR